MMSLDEKVGQMMMVGFEGTSPPAHILEWLESGRIGGIYLFARNIDNPSQVTRLVQDCREAAGFPILVGIDQEGGIVARLRDGFTESPGAMALGASRDIQLAEDVAFMLGSEMAALGINWNFAPVADIAHQRDNPSVSTRSVGSDMQLVSEIVAAQIRGFQRAGVAATVKHFPGLGNTTIDTHDALAKVTGPIDYLYDKDIVPFAKAIEDDVACVMLTHVMYTALDDKLPATLSPRIVTDLLRQNLSYDGAVCTDCMEMKAVTHGFGAGESAVLAVLAGVDMPLFSHTRARQAAAYEAVLQAAKSGRIPVSRIDESVRRISRLKRQYSLTDQPAIKTVGSDEHHALARSAARAGAVLVKHGTALPIKRQLSRIAAIEFSSRRISDAVDIASSSHFLSLISQRIPQAACQLLNPRARLGSALSAVERTLNDSDIVILLTRNAHLQTSQLRLAQRIIDRSNCVILICSRNPYDAGMLTGVDTVICTNGDSKPSLIAAVDAVCGDFLPKGKLTVSLA